MSDEIVIVADQIEMVPIGDLNTEKNRVKTHSVDQVALLAGMMQEFGFTVPILIDVRNEVIAGRGRMLAASALGLAEVPCVRTDHLSDQQIQALIIADNKSAESPWDMPNLKLEMEALKDVDEQLLALTGFDFDEIDELLDGAITEDADDGDDDPKIEFLSFGKHKIELEPDEVTDLNDLFTTLVGNRGSYKGGVRKMIESMQTGAFAEFAYSRKK